MSPANGAPIPPVIRVIALLALIVAATSLILLNAEMIVTWLSFVTLSMPLAILISLTMLVGYTGCIIMVMIYCGDCPSSTRACL